MRHRTIQVILFSFLALLIAIGPAGATYEGVTAQIAFQRGSDDAADIWVMSADGEWSKKLTGAGRDAHPAWSPDGNQIAFTGVRGGNSDIYVMNHDGSDVQRLTVAPESDAYPTWTPDGAAIVFIRDGDVHRLDLENGEISNLTDTVNTNDYRDPKVSPDGSRILVSGANGIAVVDASGGTPRPLTENRGSLREQSPDWSPDGTRIVYASQAYYQDDTQDFDIWIMNSDGSNQVRLAGSSTKDELHPVWSPDGSRIIFYAYNSGDTDIYSMASDGTDTILLTEDERMDLQASWRSCETMFSCKGYRPSNMWLETRRRTTSIRFVGGLMYPERPYAPVGVRILRRRNGNWTVLETKTLALDANGRFSTTFPRPRRGDCAGQARYFGDYDYKPNTDTVYFDC